MQTQSSSSELSPTNLDDKAFAVKEPLLFSSSSKTCGHDQESLTHHNHSLNRSHIQEVAEHFKDREGNNHLYGYAFMLMFVVANSMADSTSKLLFNSHSELGVTEMLFLRGVICLFLMAALIGR